MSTFDEHRLLTMYINQYNQTNTHIDSLLNMLDEIKANIINIIHPRRTLINRPHNNNRNNPLRDRNNNNRPHNNRHHNNRPHNNRNNNNRNNNNRQHNNSVFYDYNNPINPSIYNDFFRRRDNVFTIQNNEGINTFFSKFFKYN